MKSGFDGGRRVGYSLRQVSSAPGAEEMLAVANSWGRGGEVRMGRILWRLQQGLGGWRETA